MILDLVSYFQQFINNSYFQETISIDETPVKIEIEPESEYDEEDEESDYYDEEEEKDEKIRSAIGSIFYLLEENLRFRRIPEVVTVLQDILYRTNDSAQLVSARQYLKNLTKLSGSYRETKQSSLDSEMHYARERKSENVCCTNYSKYLEL